MKELIALKTKICILFGLFSFFLIFSYCRSIENTVIKKEKKEPMIKKPPRKSKLLEPITKTQQHQPSSQNQQNNSSNQGIVKNMVADINAGSTPGPSRRFKKNREESNIDLSSTVSCPTSLNLDSMISANNYSNRSSQRYKMLHLKKDVSGELGIIINKKRYPHKGYNGYIIAHIEPGGLVER